MKLLLTRDQGKKMLGGANFVLTVKVELTGDEADLVKKYKAHKEVLVMKEVKIPFTGKSMAFNLTIGSLVDGQTFKCGDIATILETEDQVKEACKNFKNYIEVMRHFGGQETLEF